MSREQRQKNSERMAHQWVTDSLCPYTTSPGDNDCPCCGAFMMETFPHKCMTEEQYRKEVVGVWGADKR